MATSLERRIEVLESAGGGNLPELVIMRHIVAPGRVGDPINAAEIDGQRFDRGPGESEAQFTERVGELARERREALGNRRPLIILSAADLNL